MQTLEKTPTLEGKYKHLSEKDSDKIKGLLPSSFYNDFCSAHKRLYKNRKVPAYSTVMGVLNGRHKGMRVMASLLEIIKENKSIQDQIEKVLND